MRERGRAGILHRAMEALDGVRPPALLLQGAAGAGKSYLLREIARRTSRRTVFVAARATESSWPFSGLGALVTALAGEPYTVAERSLAPVDGTAVRDIALDVLEFLRAHQPGPMVALIDDIDRFDPQSRAVLGYLSARLGGAGVSLIGTVEPLEADDPLAGWPVCEIPLLELDEALQLVREAPLSADPATASILFWQTAGNSGVLKAVLASLTDEERHGIASLPLPLPLVGPVDDIAAAATDGLDERARELLTIVAAAPLTPRTALTETAAEVDALADLFRLRLVEELDSYVRVRSPLVRAAVYGALGARERRELHARLRLRLSGTEEALSVWHGACADPQPAWGPALMAAAAQLVRADLPAAAVELAERGMTGTGNGSLSIRALELASALADAGQLRLAGRYVARIDRESLPPSEQLFFARVRLITDVAQNGRVSASEVEAAVAVHADIDPDGAVSLWSLSALLHALMEDLRTARAAVEHGRAHLDRAGPTARGLHEGVAELVEAATGHPCRPIDEEALRELSRHSTEELLARARARSLSGQTADAARIYSLIVDLPVPVEPLWRSLAVLLSAANALRAGDLGAVSAAVRQLRRGPMPQLLPSLVELVVHWTDLVVDDVDGALESMQMWMDDNTSRPAELAAGHLVLGERALFLDDPQTAVRELQYADGLGSSLASPAVLRHQPALIEALVAVGDIEGAERVLDTLAVAAQTMPHPWTQRAVLVGRALLTRGEDARHMFDVAVAAGSDNQPGYEDAMLLVRRARRLCALGASDAAVAAMQARTSLERVGAHGWARLFERSLVVTPFVAPTLLDDLTGEERAVVELVLEGMQNKEIAARLFISLRTVELRLTRIYRKTGARSRSHLVSLVA